METALGEKGDLFAPVQGLLLIEVDDLFSAGTELHQKRMKELRKKYKMGRWTTTKQTGGGVFAGRRIEQTANMGFKIDMKDYIQEKLKPVKIDKIRRKNVEAPLTDKEKSVLKAVIGSLQWVQRQCRLDVTGPTSLLSGRQTISKISDLLEADKIIAHLQKSPDRGMIYTPVDPREAHLIVVQDGSLHNVDRVYSQGALVIGVADRAIAEGRRGVLNLVAWRSGKINRVVNSSLDSESKSMAAALRCAEWTQKLFAEATNSLFPLLAESRLADEWNCSSPERPFQCFTLRGVCIVKDTLEKQLQQVLAVTDAKSLYDLLKSDLGRGKDWAVAATCAEVKQFLKVLQADVRWVPHNEMIVDPLTKVFGKSNLAPLLGVMDSGRYKLKSVNTEMNYRKQLKESGAKVQRLKGASTYHESVS